MNRSNNRRGGALLAVMWFAAALTAIAFALSIGVRADFDRASVQADSLRAYYLAHGAVEATIRRIARSPRAPVEGQDPPLFVVGQRFMHYRFEGGEVEVEIVAEGGKLDVNRASAEGLSRLMAASGVDPGLAVQLAVGIVAYREQLRAGEVLYGVPVDQALEEFGNLEADPSFRPARASIQELEELLSIPGMTPDLLYGSYQETNSGTLVRRIGLVESLTTRGAAAVDVAYAPPVLLTAAGFPQGLIEQLVEIRRLRPLTAEDPGMADLIQRGGEIPLGLGRGGSAYTLRATAELNGARARHTVAALVQADVSDSVDPLRIVRWYDNPF
jgi:general secretion pathway protein K